MVIYNRNKNILLCLIFQNDAFPTVNIPTYYIRKIRWARFSRRISNRQETQLKRKPSPARHNNGFKQIGKLPWSSSSSDAFSSSCFMLSGEGIIIDTVNKSRPRKNYEAIFLHCRGSQQFFHQVQRQPLNSSTSSVHDVSIYLGILMPDHPYF